MTPLPRQLILFDIDGTLLSTQGLGAEAIIGGVRDVFGVPQPPPGYSMAGKTDSLIVLELAAAGGIPDAVIRRDRPRALARSAELLEAGFRTNPRGRLLPGIRPLVDRLASDSAWGLGLLTGNTHPGARLKLSHFGIWDRFAFGAFGDDDEDRNALPAVARIRARETYGVDFDPGRVVVVGDTVRDIACARAGGMRAAAVATGGDRYETLQALKPDLLFRSFEDVVEAMRALNLSANPS